MSTERFNAEDLLFEFHHYSKDSDFGLANKVGLSIDSQDQNGGIEILGNDWEEILGTLEMMKQGVYEEIAKRPKTVKLSLEVDVHQNVTQSQLESIMHFAAAKVSELNTVIESRVSEA